MNDLSQDKQDKQDRETRLLELLEKEIGYFGQIRELTQQQAKLLEEDEAESLDASLDSRWKLIEEINGLHQESDVLMQSYVSFAYSGDGHTVESIERAVTRRQELIAECVALNERNTTAAKEKAESYIRRIGKLSMSRKSLEVYIPDLPNTPELIDRKT